MIIDYKKMGQLIRQIRLKDNLSQRYLARLIDCSFAHIHHIEKGNRVPGFKTIEPICKVLDIDPKELIILCIDLPDLKHIQDQIMEKMNVQNLHELPG